jgi:hypothetical protein
MTKVSLRYGAVIALATVSLAAVAVNAVAASARPTAKAVDHTKATIARSAKRGPRGSRGPRGFQGPRGANGAQGPQGVQGVQGPAAPTGGVGFKNFTGDVAGSGSESVTVGSFTLTENAIAGTCTSVALTDNSSFNYYVSWLPDSNGDPGLDPTLDTANTTASPVAANSEDTFAAALSNGSSSITATIMNVSETSNTCLTVGYVAGS